VTEYFRDRHTFYLRVYVCVDVRGVDVCASLTLAYVNKASCPFHYKLGSWIDFVGGEGSANTARVSALGCLLMVWVWCYHHAVWLLL